jgi:peroxiredoxin family protein
MAKMVIGLASGSIDKLVGAGVIMSGAAAADMDIEVYVLLTAARAFLKENEGLQDSFIEYPHLKNEMLERMQELKMQNWVDAFRQVKEFTNVKIYICSLAGKMWKGDSLDQYIDIVDDFTGIFQYVEAAQSADLHMNL